MTVLINFVFIYLQVFCSIMILVTSIYMDNGTLLECVWCYCTLRLLHATHLVYGKDEQIMAIDFIHVACYTIFLLYSVCPGPHVSG